MYKIAKWSYWCVLGISIMVVVLFGYISIAPNNSLSITDSYNSMTNTKNNMYQYKKITFIASYINETGDLSLAEYYGYSLDDLNIAAEEAPAGDGAFGSSIIEVTKIVASTYNGSYKKYSPAFSDAVYNGRSIKTEDRDCSCLVNGTLYLLGLEPYMHLNSEGYYSDKRGKKINAITFADVKAGDVLAKKGHVAIVAEVDEVNKVVRMADAGGNDQIKNTAARGWHKEYQFSDTIQSWRKGESIVVRRYF